MSAAGGDLAGIKSLLSALRQEAAELKQAVDGPVTDAVAGWLAAQYVSAAHAKLSAAEGAGRWGVLRLMVQDWAALRRGDHAAARLELDRAELDWQRENSRTQREKEFREWLKRPEIRAEFFPEVTRGLSTETLRKIEKELGLL